MRKILLFSGLMLLSQAIFAQLSWTKEIHDFGQAQLNVPLAYEFSYLNYTSNNQKIAFIKSSTNGVKPNWDNVMIQTNQTGALRLSYIPQKAGKFEEIVEVYLENNPYPQILTISGFVGDSDAAGYYKPSISGSKVTPKPANNKLVVPPKVTTNQPAKPSKKRIKIGRKKKYQDDNLSSNTPPAATTKPTKPIAKPATKPAVKPIRRPNSKPQKPQGNTPAKPQGNKPQKPGRPQVASGNTDNGSLLKTNILPTYVGNVTHNTAANENYMTLREKAMVQEINLLRSNPKAYAKVVQAHVAAMEADKSSGDYYKGEIEAGKNLIEQLAQTPTLSILYPSQNIYKSAVAHGKEGKELGDLNHQGKDGLWPWDRVKNADKNMQNGNENIVGGMSDIRKSVLTLLIDAGIPGYMHRKTLLTPEWTHVACHEIGDIGGMPNMWLQKFGEAKAGISPNTPSTGYNQNNGKPSKPRVSRKPGKPNTNKVSGMAMSKPQKPGKPMRKPQNTANVFDNYTASTTTINTPVNVETNELSINNLGKNIFPDADCRTAEKAVYMSEREQEMLAEINLLRTQPQRYVEVVDDYVSFIGEQVKANPDAKVFYAKELKSAAELIELLDRLSPLNAIKPNRNLYKGARIYGEEAKVSGNLARQSSDGSMPWNRILRYAPNMVDGEENLPYGSTNIRYSIIKLLIDKDDKLRRQRKVLLNPKWDFSAIYEVGKVANVHYWIQDFGEGNTSVAMHDLENSNNTNEVLGFAATTAVKIETGLLPDIQAAADGINYEVAYLSEKEKTLLQEINFLRTKPAFYADIANEYIQTLESKKAQNSVKADYYQEQIEAAQFIYEHLTKVKAVAAIQPNQMLHNAAYNHGKDCQKSGRLQHWGSDGSNTWQRLQGAAPGIIDGDQVLVGDAVDLREAVVLMLVNQVLYNRNRELILLQSQWTNIAATDVGTVGKRNNCWIITLGQL